MKTQFKTILMALVIASSLMACGGTLTETASDGNLSVNENEPEDHEDENEDDDVFVESAITQFQVNRGTDAALMNDDCRGGIGIVTITNDGSLVFSGGCAETAQLSQDDLEALWTLIESQDYLDVLQADCETEVFWLAYNIQSVTLDGTVYESDFACGAPATVGTIGDLVDSYVEAYLSASVFEYWTFMR